MSDDKQVSEYQNTEAAPEEPKAGAAPVLEKSDEPKAIAKPSDPKTEKEKRGPGRPPKGAPVVAPSEPAPKKRKPDDEIKDPRGACIRAIDSLNVNLRAYQVEHPESDLQWAWKRIREVCPEEKGRIGAPVDESAFSPIVRGPVRGIEMIGALGDEDKATAEEINEVAAAWSRASTHLGLSERAAAIGSAISKSAGLLGRQLTRTVVSIIGEGDAESAIEKPIEAPAFEAEKRDAP